MVIMRALLITFCGALFIWSGLVQGKACDNNTHFLVGAGIYDITGPAAEVGMMGYGMIHQKTGGISQRLWARAFIIESPCNGKRVVFVNADLGQVFQAVKEHVVKKLRIKYKDKYTDQNVLITATHTHSGPGGYSTYALYDITTLGFNQDNFNVIVDGIVKAIERAQDNITPATINLATGDLPGVSFNRSPMAYLENPTAERAGYLADVDTEMTLLRFDSLDNKPIGMINWFPLHGVSLNNKNVLISGDNKGLAEYLFEKDFQSDYGSKAFVAAFAQAHSGDVSPNPYGTSGQSGEQGRLALEKAAKPQYEKAKELYKNANTLVTGGIDFRHQFVAMDNVQIDKRYTDGVVRYTCPAAIGLSMLAGTQDGEGIGKQGISCGDVKDVISYLACQLVTTTCQREKPIAIETGTKFPYPWTPKVLPLQLVQIGNLVIIAAPFELTTMTGRRLIDSVKKVFKDKHVVISALSNAYAGYVATNEEYHLQRYEAASTHFGPWQQAALQQEFVKLANAMRNNQSVKPGPTPLDLIDEQIINLQTEVWFDDKPLTVNFGSLQQDVKSTYSPGETVEVVFWGGHPKNNLHTQNSFLEVQQLKNNEWITIRYDRDYDTEYHWNRNGLAYSLIKIVWRTARDTEKGTYRIVHHGDWKSGWSQEVESYTGYSSKFDIT